MQTFEVIKKTQLQHSSTWLITGVAGFIGSHLLEFLLSHRQKVVGLDNFITGHRRNLEEVLARNSSYADNFTFIEGDIRQYDVCREAVADVDFILHQAAIGSVPRSIKDPLTTHEINANGFLNVLIAAKEGKVKRFVYASSSSVYGDSPILPKVETHQGNPLSPYAVSKMTNELYARAFANCYGLEITGLRYFNVFGPRQDPNGTYAAVIPLWIKALLSDETVYINGDGKTSRDFCYVANAVQANILAAFSENSASFNRVYNVAVGQQTTLIELYEYLKKRTGKTGHKPTYRDFRPGDIQHSLADINKAQELLGYNPSHSIFQGLDETIDWYKQQLMQQKELISASKK